MNNCSTAILRSIFFGLVLWRLATATSAGEPNRAEYDLLQKMPRPMLGQMVPERLGTTILGRGGCRYLTAAVALGDEERAADAWKSIQATFATQIDDGGFAGGGKPGDLPITVYAIRVENAYFFLQELGRALLVLQASPLAPRFQKQVEEVTPKMRRACDFIQKGYPTILPKVGHTANRLVIAAKAFGLCGLVLNDAQMIESAHKLLKLALERRDDEGVFIERGGRDSSYNAVVILMGQHLSIYVPEPELDAAIEKAMRWERTRIKPTGEIEIEGNTRTGTGKELAGSGGIKQVNYREVSEALFYYGVLHNEPETVHLAQQVHSWDVEHRRGK
ncbi:MAG TPA: hypothetical protein VHD36_03660 [Pirellulales bacterium]|nr:hypothetical protein [Pirellulales bacterium]